MEIRNVAVIGGGLMGRQIALNAAIYGYQVKLTDNYAPVLTAVREWAALTDQVRDALAKHQYGRLPALLDRNFDLRCEVCGSSVSEKNRRMVQIARQFGASAKFTGSGGAIIGTYEDEAMFEKLRAELKKYQVEVIKPLIVHNMKDAYS